MIYILSLIAHSKKPKTKTKTKTKTLNYKQTAINDFHALNYVNTYKQQKNSTELCMIEQKDQFLELERGFPLPLEEVSLRRLIM